MPEIGTFEQVYTPGYVYNYKVMKAEMSYSTVNETH